MPPIRRADAMEDDVSVGLVARLVLVHVRMSSPWQDAWSLRDVARLACVCREWRDTLQEPDGRTAVRWEGEALERGSGGAGVRTRAGRSRGGGVWAAGHDLVWDGGGGKGGDRLAVLLSASALLGRPGQAASLTTLELARCGLTDAGASVLARALAGAAVCLEDLSVRCNEIGDAGAAAVATLLVEEEARVPLQALCLADNVVGEAGARALALALRRGGVQSCLVSLDLSGNAVGDAGGEALAESVGWASGTRAKGGLLKVDLRGNGIGNGRRHRARLVLNAALARASPGGEPPREAGAVGTGRRVSLVSLVV